MRGTFENWLVVKSLKLRTSSSIGHWATQTVNNSRSTRLEISDSVKMSFSRASYTSSSEIKFVFVLVPEVQVGDHHLSGGDGHPLVGVPVDDVDVFVAFGGQDHCELSAVFSENGNMI